MAIVVNTILGKNGELKRDRSKEETKTFRAVHLTADPFAWTEIVKKDTDCLDEAFVKTFLETAGLQYDKLQRVMSWFPAYYVAFLMEVSHCVTTLGADRFKSTLLEYESVTALDKFKPKIEAIVSSVDCSEIDENTDIGVLSDVFNKLTDIDFVLPTFA